MNDHYNHRAPALALRHPPEGSRFETCEACPFSKASSLSGQSCRSCNCITNAPVRKELKRRVVVREGSVRDSTLLVLSGVLKMSTSLPDGRTQIVGLRFPGEVVTTRMFGDPWFAAIEVVKDAKLCVLSKKLVERLLSTSPDFSAIWNFQANQELAAAQNHVVTLGQKMPAERLAAFLIELRDRGSHASTTDMEVIIPISRDEIGAYLGLESETVSRQFTRLKGAGLIILNSPSRVLIRDLAALERLGQGESVIADA